MALGWSFVISYRPAQPSLSLFYVVVVDKVRRPLTIIGPGEVKVDLANFDLKLQENLLSTLYIYIFFYPFLQKRLPDLFELLT